MPAVSKSQFAGLIPNKNTPRLPGVNPGPMRQPREVKDLPNMSLDGTVAAFHFVNGTGPKQTKPHWKSNPNQMAMPGMEEHAHPGAVHLAQGYTFADTTHLHTLSRGFLTSRRMDIIHPEGHTAGYLEWNGAGTGKSRGEIEMIETHPEEQRKGVATALYGVGRTMARVKPRHSTVRTPRGDAWAKKASTQYGGRVPKKNLFNPRG